MTWDYRILEAPLPTDPHGEVYHRLVECHYDKSGNPKGYTEVTIADPAGDLTPDGVPAILLTLEWVAAAAFKPALTLSDFT